ncbi:MAG: Crp/Fnr family transcriptional regulator [Limnochordaceae bacterium]|nr:Crp/Fnr family transcriptional regulator [Limnochordaceae bacterium]
MSMQSAQPLTRWWALTRGDVDATVAQVGLNLAQMIIPVFLLLPAGISAAFSTTHLLPGYALGFLVGSLGLAFLGIQLGRRQARSDVTSHVYGNNVPAILAYTLSIMLPVYLDQHDPVLAWEIAAGAVIWTGLIKLAMAPLARRLRAIIPVPASMTVFGTAMYSYLALILLQRLFDNPIVGLVALAIVAAAVLARLRVTRWGIPPFLVVWPIPLAIGLAIGYVRPTWQGIAPTVPWAVSLGSFPSTTVLFSAITDARLLLFDYEDFCAALDSDPAMMRLLFSQLQQRFLVAVEQCLVFSSEADQAVAFTLRSLAEALGDGRSSEVAVKLPVVREQIAMLSGKSVPSANRALQRLRRQGKVRLDRATITVPGEFRIASSERRWLWQG